MFKKTILLALVLTIGIAVLPITGVSAATNITDEPVHPGGQLVSDERIEQVWERLQTTYVTQGERLDKSDAFIAKIQERSTQGNARGWDTSAVQAALDAFVAAIPNAQAAHEPGAAIIATHSGFDVDGKVTDRAAAIETVQVLRQVIKDTRTAMNGTGEALREAIKAFIEVHRINQAPTP